MFELILAVFAAVGIGRFGEIDRGQGVQWGLITFGLCLASLLIPLPFLRIGLACIVAFVLMMVTKKTYY